MSYTPTNWQAGDIVTAASMNKIEQGIAGAGAFIVHSAILGNTETLDKTWQEIYNASGQTIVIFITGDEDYLEPLYLQNIGIDNGIYGVSFANASANCSFMANSTSAYPSYNISPPGEIAS